MTRRNSNVASYSPTENEGRPKEGAFAPWLYLRHGEPIRFRGVILGNRERVVIPGRGEAMQPVDGKSKAMVASLDSPPDIWGERVMAASVRTDGSRRHTLVGRHGGDKSFNLVLRTGLPYNASAWSNLLLEKASNGVLPSTHGYMIDDGSLAVESHVEFDHRRLVQHLNWSVAGQKFDGTKVPLWRMDFLRIQPNATVYVFGPFGEITLFAVNPDGTLRQEEVTGEHAKRARAQFETQEAERMAYNARRAAERAAAKAAETSIESTGQRTMVANPPQLEPAPAETSRGVLGGIADRLGFGGGKKD